MRAYIGTTGAIFGLLTMVHIYRALGPEPEMLKDPWWWLITLLAAGLCLWAVALWRRAR
jgi:hypothetical protein